jgi:hypothetical protein
MKSRPGQGLTVISKKIRLKQNDHASRRTQRSPHTRREQHRPRPSPTLTASSTPPHAHPNQKLPKRRALLRSSPGCRGTRGWLRVLALISPLLANRVEKQRANNEQHHDHNHNADRERGMPACWGLVAAVISHEIENFVDVRSASSYPTRVSEGLWHHAWGTPVPDSIAGHIERRSHG